MTYITLMPSLVLLRAQNLPIDCVQIKYHKRDLGIQDKKQKLLKNILHSRATLHKRTVFRYWLTCLSGPILLAEIRLIVKYVHVLFSAGEKV
jgi:hypothetical protein